MTLFGDTSRKEEHLESNCHREGNNKIVKPIDHNTVATIKEFNSFLIFSEIVM